MHRENHLQMIPMPLKNLLLNPELSAWARKHDHLTADQVPRGDDVSQGYARYQMGQYMNNLFYCRAVIAYKKQYVAN